MRQFTEVLTLDVSDPASIPHLNEQLSQGWQLLQVVVVPPTAGSAASAGVDAQFRQIAWLSRPVSTGCDSSDPTRSLTARLDATVLETVRQRGAAIRASTGSRPRPSKATLADLVARLKESFSAEEVRASVARLAAEGRLTLDAEIQDGHARADVVLVLVEEGP
jgi:hypothetical protein